MLPVHPEAQSTASQAGDELLSAGPETVCSTAQTSLHAARSSSAVYASGYLLRSHQAHLHEKALCMEEGARIRRSNNLDMYNCVGGRSLAKTVTCRALQDHER